MIDDEVTVTEGTMVRDEQPDGRVEVLALICRGRVRGHETVAVEHHAVRDAFCE